VQGATGAVRYIVVMWTPSRGQEGVTYRLCFVAGLDGQLPPSSPCDVPGGSGAGCQRRCFYVSVARCQYCALAGDSVQSIATAFGASWLQVWASNAAPFPSPAVDPNAPTLWDAESSPDAVAVGDLVQLGPVYVSRAGDTLASIAARFGSSVSSVLSLNADLPAATDPSAALPAATSVCVLPRMCA